MSGGGGVLRGEPGGSPRPPLSKRARGGNGSFPPRDRAAGEGRSSRRHRSDPHPFQLLGEVEAERGEHERIGGDDRDRGGQRRIQNSPEDRQSDRYRERG